MSFQRWIEEQESAIKSRLIPALAKDGMLLPEFVYRANGVGADLNLATIADFNSLISISQQHQTPVYALTATQLAAVGVVLEGFEASRDAFHAEFASLARRVIDLVDAALTVSAENAGPRSPSV